MLHLITSIDDSFIEFIKDDPVRPEIPREFRIQKNRFIAVLVEEEKPISIVCVSLHNFIPKDINDLENTVDDPTTAVFYTIWSYKPGAGRKLLIETVSNLKTTKPNIKTYVTLSPKTELAKKFHLKNGAFIFRENVDTINYQYPNTF